MLIYESEGYCPICEAPAMFRSQEEWFRDYLACTTCWSLVRERALALVLNEVSPNWRDKVIHESSPADRGISGKMRRECNHYIGTHFFPGQELGTRVGDWRNENLERQTFADGSFDLVVSLDVMEHVFHPQEVYREIYRTLKPGGVYLHTFPINKDQVTASITRARLESDGRIIHLVDEPEYHGNPIDDRGALVTMAYGYDITRAIAEWAPFDVRICRFWDAWHGIIGEYTEVAVCTRRETPRH